MHLFFVNRKSYTFPKETEDLQDSIFKTLQYTESITPGHAYNNLDQSSCDVVRVSTWFGLWRIAFVASGGWRNKKGREDDEGGGMTATWSPILRLIGCLGPETFTFCYPC
jgi:hypothetical protein